MANRPRCLIGLLTLTVLELVLGIDNIIFIAILSGKLPRTEQIAYGSHERQRLDVYLPSERAAAPPVVLFVHGGGFVSGHRNRTAQIYSNVTSYLAQHGIAAINVGYRLATHVTYPGATHDIAAAVELGSHPC